MKKVKWTLWALAFALIFAFGLTDANRVIAQDIPEDEAIGGPAGKDSPKARKLLDILKIEEQAEEQTAEHYFESGKNYYQRMQYREASRDFKRASRLAPDSEKYRHWYMKTLWILGDRKGEICDVARTLIDERRVRIHQATVEMERQFVEAYRLFRERKYEDSIYKFERVLETIKWFPFFIDQKNFEDKTKHWINLSKLRAKQQERKKLDTERTLARQSADSQKAEQERFLRLRIRSLYKRARELFSHKKWERCERVCVDILRMEPNNEDAQKLKDAAIRYRHVTIAMTNVYEKIKQKKIALEYVDRAAVPYMFIMDYPEEDEWRKICQREIPIEQQIKKSITEEEIRIKSKLENQKVTLSFEDTPFKDAISFLRDITGLNFVISTAADDVIISDDLRVNLKIKNVRLKTALKLILETGGDQLRYRIKNGVIYITTDETEEEEVFLEFYVVSEIINHPPDFPAPELALRDWGGTRDVGTSNLAGPGSGGAAPILDLDDEEGESAAPGWDVEELEGLIKKIAGGEDDEGIELHGGLLVVRKSIEVHKKIQKLLAMLRRTVGMMVTVEARFVDVQKNFLEEVGLDWTNLGVNVASIVGDKDAGFTYALTDPQIDIRASLIQHFSQPVQVVSFPFNITNQGGSGIHFNMLEDFQIEALIDAVQKTQKAHLLHAPRITVFNTQRSHICALYQTAYIEDVELDISGPIPLLNPVIGILHHGAIMEARPVISYDKKYVTLEVKPTLAINQKALERTHHVTLGFTDLDITLPYLTVQKIRSTVLIPDGGVVLVGGMKDMREFKQRSAPPILGHIPLLKFIFQRRGETILKRNVVVLVRADITIVHEEEEKRFGFTTEYKGEE